ncbi:taste receptor type 2 member 4-like [Hyla sarda]|uniref:taste receptor type 2 member 4-like n=1 Tax=Hyla sarda TaxID=327740 RepID=UPI0024C3DA0F|nr:taste receptor type 2 member 4-like [Hyla sarda]
MELSIRILKAITLILGTISGISINSSIVAEYCRTWTLQHQPGVYILFSTVVTNLLLQCSVTFDGFLYTFENYMIFVHEVYVTDFTILYFLIELSFWNTAWLSVYYCLKLLNLPYRFFFQMKLRFSTFVPQLLVGSVIGTLLINVPFLWTLQITILPNMTDYKFSTFYPHTIFNTIFGCCLPFLITFTSIVLSVSSLLSHITKIKSPESHFTRPQLKAHMGAVRTMVTHLVLDLILCLVSTGLLISQQTLGIMMDTACWIFLMVYSTFQSIIFILGNPKLKKKLFICKIIRQN